MASSSSPFAFNLLSSSSPYPSSPSLYFLTPNHRSQSSKSFKLWCSHHTIQLETHQIHTPKKKRKPRPSFLEQIHDKWSQKPTSLRQTFPWQEQEQEKEAMQEEEEEKSRHFSGVGGSEPRIEDNSVGFGSANRVIVAPWVQRSKTITQNFDSARRNSQNSDDISKRVSSSFVEELGNSEKEVIFDGKFEEIGIDVDEDAKTPIAFSERERKVSVSDPKIEGFEGFSDKCDTMRLPWERGSGVKPVKGDGLRKSNTKIVEVTIPEPELKRLRNVALRMVERFKIGKAGITQALVDSIHEKWKKDEVVKLKFEGPPTLNMKRTHEILERRTGGIVIWRSGSSVVLFRGMTYKLHCVQSYTKQVQANTNASRSSKDSEDDCTLAAGQNGSTTSLGSSSASSARYAKDLSEEELMDLSELNLLLDELGPRFKDWSGRDPLPVDADLLPPVVPGYKRPFRLLPYGVRHGLRDKAMTFFRRSARTMPPHFALGRNRELQGLAAAMVKLWEKSALAKIAIKRGVLNTLNERMAEELKLLTGGTLLSRNKDYIVFYRGNDFLPPGVTKALVEAQTLTALQQDEEDEARKKASSSVDSNAEAAKRRLVAGTLAETLAATSRWGKQPSSEEREKQMRDAALARQTSLVRYLEKKLTLAKGKVRKAEKALEKVQKYLEPSELPADLETLTDEERFLFRKIGLSMKPYLVLGRRGIFDGTIENMHLHWKFRELALKHHITELQGKIEKLKSELDNMKTLKEIDEETLYLRIDNSSDDEDIEEGEDEEAYLEIYNSGDEGGNT
ncbi:hypothetical protein RJ639_008383 [Escallonia herrerae]|uniref:CRM domain-containing protein n=1 Tax=Escallonia herrerae TaxID=1293975 RepID=A0AA89AUI2_9ASTE|nr:hypothetical protein RJ639_008383 [Escallonia herrerae]